MLIEPRRRFYFPTASRPTQAVPRRAGHRTPKTAVFDHGSRGSDSIMGWRRKQGGRHAESVEFRCHLSSEHVAQESQATPSRFHCGLFCE